MMLSPILLAVGLAAAVPAGPPAEKPVVAPPAVWVKPVTIPSAIGTSDAAIRMLLVDQQIYFGADGDSLYNEMAARIQTPQGLTEAGSFAVRWKPETDVVTVHKLHILRGKEVIDVLAKGPGFTILRREDNLEYAALDGALTATLQIEGLQIGDVIDVAYTIRRNDPLLGGHSDLIVGTRLRGPVSQLGVAAAWPATKKMQVRTNDPPVAPLENGASGRFALSAANVDPLVGPKGAPPRFWKDGQVEFSDYASWADVATTFAPLYVAARKLRADSPLKAEIARIRAASPDPTTRVEAAMALVQDQVRYVFLGMNDGNLRPADADTSWQRRFGDCKGKTALLLALLDGLDIVAEPALVSVAGGDGLDERLPAAGPFDHVIVRATVGGKVYWLDGTRVGDTSLARLRVPPFRWALPLHADAKLERLIVAPLDQPEDVTEVRLDATAGFDKPAKAHIETRISGDSANMLRLRLANLQQVDLDRFLREYWKGRFDFITATSVSARFDMATATEYLSLDGMAKMDWNLDNGTYYELDGARLGWRPDFDREPGPHRDAPFATSYPSYSVDRETIQLPNAGKGFWIQGKDVDEKLAGYHFRRKTRLNGATLTMEASTRSEVPELSAAEAAKSSDALRELSKRGVFLQPPEKMAAARSAKAAPDAPPTQLSIAAQHQQKAEQLFAGDDMGGALKEATAAIRADPAMIEAYQARARIFRKQGKLEDAAAQADLLIKTLPANARALTAAGTIYCAANRSVDGLETFAKALAVQPADNVYVERARCRPANDASGRRTDLSAALKINPKSAGALSMLARIQREQGDHAGEIESLSTLVAVNQSFPAKTLLGGAYLRDGQEAAAAKLFAQVREASAKNAQQMNGLCWEAATAGRFLKQAEADCRAGLALQKGDAAILDSLGLVLLRQGRYDEAIASYDAALKIAPQQASAMFGRGLARAGKKDIDAARADFDAARAMRKDIDAIFRSYGLASSVG